MNRWLCLLLFVGCTAQGPPRVEGPPPPMAPRAVASPPGDGGWGKIRLSGHSDGPVLARLDARHELIRSHGLEVRETSSGRTAVLDPTGSEFVALQDGVLLYLTAAGKLALLRPGRPPRLAERYGRVVARSADATVLAAVTQPIQLVVYRHAEIETAFTLAGVQAGPRELAADLSPDGKRLAVGYPEETFKTAGLVVLNLDTGGVDRIHGGVPVRVSSAERIPTLECGWVDDRTVRFSVSEEDGFHWCDLDLEAGRQYDRGAYAPIGPRHLNPLAVWASGSPGGSGPSAGALPATAGGP